MRKSVYIAVLLLITGTLTAQQLPFMEGYNINSFSMSPAYAGLHNINTLFSDYRSDWTGMDGGPVTCQLSYNTHLYKNVGVGGRFIYDKTDIFKQTLLLGTYSYEVKFTEKHVVNFGLSAGLYRNSIDVAKYFNDPTYVIDGVLISGMEKSKFNFVSDVSALYRFGNLEAGVLFSNLMFGSIKYNNLDVSYKPFKNYLIHSAYNFMLSDRWDVKPFILVRGGKNAPDQIEVAATATYKKLVWGTALVRSGGILGFGAGAQVMEGILVNYSYNLSTGVAMNTFGSHQLTIGFRLFKPGARENQKAERQKRIEIPILKEEPVVQVVPENSKVKGTIVRKGDSKAVSGTLTVSENNKEVQKTAVNNGVFNLELKSGKIYKLDLSSDNYATVSQTVNLSENQTINDLKFVVDYISAVKGNVTDQSTGAIINATITISRNGVEEQTINANGPFAAKLQQGYVYQFEYKADGYFNKRIDANMTSQDVPEFNIQLEKIKKEAFGLGAINFEPGKSIITKESLHILDEFISLLKDNPEVKFEISGHTDNIGAPDYNKKVSADRAKACVTYMISKGIAADRLKPVGYGQDQPLFPNTNTANRAKNRRVEGKVIE